VVNADDLGASAAVNDRIEALMSVGLVTSATINANAPAVEEAAAIAKRHGGASIGVHLNIGEYQPLSGLLGLEPLLDAEGRFRRHSLHGAGSSRRLMRAIHREWSAQVKMVVDLGIRPSHLDSHHGVHRHLRFRNMLVALCREFGIPAIRPPTCDPKGLRRRVKDYAWRWSFCHAGIIMPDHFTSLRQFVDCPPELPAGSSLELVVHPGFPIYAEETEILASGRWRELLPQGFELISYRQLVNQCRDG
jgi:predicted glycoside hydrolase/deacetylase ChbG (UPF0249 family)